MRVVIGTVVMLGFAIFSPSRAAAQVELKISEGRVSLIAKDATAGQILNEWARVGDTRIVNADRVPGGPLNLQLENVSEQEALDLLLRSAAGFVAVSRAVPISATSRFDRILILPTSIAPPRSIAPDPRPVSTVPPAFAQPQWQPVPPPGPPAVPQQPVYPPGVNPVIGPNGLPVLDDQQDDDDPRQQAPFRPLPNVPVPVSPDEPAVPARSPASSAPTGAVGAPVPGMVVPAPQPGRPTEDR